MIKIDNITVVEKNSGKTILQNINFKVKNGDAVFIQGENGSGKSTLLNTIMGEPSLKVISGNIVFNRKIVNKLELQERSKLGIFLANQIPIEIPGVSLREFLRIIYNIHHSSKLPVFKFKKILEEKAKLINYPTNLLNRNLNEGFSGGEKKKTEILQLILIEPKLILLDEVDSGLDKKSRLNIFKGLSSYKKANPKSIWIIVSHYNEIQDYFNITKRIILKNGKLA